MYNTLPILVWYSLIVAVSSSSYYFFHEFSSVLIHPKDGPLRPDFGFAMGFQPQKNRLVIGAPSVDIEGKVYTCGVKYAEQKHDISCEDKFINITGLATYPTKKQHLYMGASITATPEYFLTCAPLWTFKFKEDYIDAVGTCFIVYDNDTVLYKGTYEQYYKKNKAQQYTSITPDQFLGGTGWSTLADEENDLLLIVKGSLQGDIAYTSLKNPKQNTNSTITQGINLNMKNLFNFGFGITSGKFFTNKTVFAFSTYNRKMEGMIDFLEYNKYKRRKKDIWKLDFMNKKIQSKFTIQSKEVATMFGSTMAAVDLNMDTLSDLLVGAPLHTEDECVECGALYVYKGGDMDTINDRNALQIIGVSEFGRFGTAIVTKDLDGDGIPEVVVSAPYEDKGAGAVYVLYGYELYQEMSESHQVMLSELKYTQKIQKKEMRTLGYSLQFISDTDENGCDELVVGAPGSGAAVLFKCIQFVNVELSYGDVQTVREQDENFNITVCVNVKYPKLPKFISASISVNSSIVGEATIILKPIFTRDISCNDCPQTKPFCENVTVDLLDQERGEYTFSSQVTLHNTDHIKDTEFNKSWVIASPASVLKKSVGVLRHCNGEDCNPDLSLEILWSRSNNETYVLGSSAYVNATILIHNDGNSSYEACVFLQVNGASLSQESTLMYCTYYMNGYSCQLLPKPFKRGTQRSIDLIFDMKKPTNEHTSLTLRVLLYEKCYTESTLKGENITTISYIMPTDDICIASENHTKVITEKEIVDENDVATVFNDQEFSIRNKGSVTWKRVTVKISIEPFISIFKASTPTLGSACKELSTDEESICESVFDLLPNTTQNIIITTEVLKSDLKNYMNDNKLNITWKIELELPPENKKIVQFAESIIVYQKELTIANNKWLLGGIVAFIAITILIIIFAILYKRGFFHRKQKRRLHVLRESFKQRSSRRNTHMSSAEDDPGLIDFEVDNDDDCAFEAPSEPQNSSTSHTVSIHESPALNRLSKIEEKGEEHS